ncbi:MAG: capping complex subunit for YIEGIA [Halanaerobiales bacterium]
MANEIDINNRIIAVVTEIENKEKVNGGGVPFFFTENEDETEEISMLLARVTLGMVHDLGNGVKVVIKH